MLSKALLALAGLAAARGQSPSLTGSTYALGNLTYWLSPTPASQLSLINSSEGVALQNHTSLVPFTVIVTNSSSFIDSDLSATLASYQATDDVWNMAFTAGLYINATGNVSFSNSSAIVLTTSGTPASMPLPPGPYLVDPLSGNVFQPWLLNEDTNEAFVYGTVPDGNGGFMELDTRIDGMSTLTVAVPSRLYFTPTPEQPLAGARLAVKDIFDVQGLRTGCGNRAFYALYPPKNASCPAVQRLLDGGAVLVGKTKASQFANGETATADWVDQHAPFNPRGEGYQDAGASSTGSGAGVAAYPWLDYAIGSDTGGSVRSPASVDGVYGNRPSQDAVPLDGVMPLSPVFDTAGVLTRDAKMWKTFGDWWLQNFTQYNQYPKKILIPVDIFGSSYLSTPPQNGTADAMFNTFIQKLEGFLNTTRTEFNMTTMWNTTSPIIANVSNPPPPLTEYLNTTYAFIAFTDQVPLVADPFIHDYQAAHGGDMPFIDPSPLERWTFGRTLDPAQVRPPAFTNKTVFLNWFRGQVLGGSNNQTCANSLFLYPQSVGATNYRNRYFGPPTSPYNFIPLRIAVHAGTPDFVLPIGDLPYNSTITGTQKFLPVTLSVVTQAGCDLMLFSLFAALQDAGILNPVKTGPTMFV